MCSKQIEQFLYILWFDKGRLNTIFPIQIIQTSHSSSWAHRKKSVISFIKFYDFPYKFRALYSYFFNEKANSLNISATKLAHLKWNRRYRLDLCNVLVYIAAADWLSHAFNVCARHFFLLHYTSYSYHYYYHLEQLFTMWAFKHILEFQISFDKIDLWLACLFSASFCFRFHFMANITVLFSFFATIWYIIFWSLWTFVIVFFPFSSLVLFVCTQSLNDWFNCKI